MNQGIWSRLPFELIERVLSFMPAPDLCRLRSVCKLWNELFCKPSFHDLCEQNRKENAYLLVTRHLDYGEFSEIDPVIENSTSLLDLDARRWYFLKCGESPAAVNDGRTVQLLTMDEGLVCEMISTAGMYIDVALAISDSITGTRREIIELPLFCYPEEVLPIIVTTADATTRTYKVFLISNSDENMVCMYVSESSDDEFWHELKRPPDELGKGPALSAVIFRGIMYVIFRRVPGQKFALLKYNLEEDVWELVKVNIPKKKRQPQLVVSCNRLFIMFWLGESSCLPEQSSQRKFRLSFQVREILVAENSSRMVVQITKTHLQQMFGEEDADFDIAYAVPFLNSGGMCKSIVLMSTLSGKLISYNPMNGSMALLPAHPQSVRPVRDKDPDSPTTFYQGKYTNLSLRNLSSQFLR